MSVVHRNGGSLSSMSETVGSHGRGITRQSSYDRAKTRCTCQGMMRGW